MQHEPRDYYQEPEYKCPSCETRDGMTVLVYGMCAVAGAVGYGFIALLVRVF